MCQDMVCMLIQIEPTAAGKYERQVELNKWCKGAIYFIIVYSVEITWPTTIKHARNRQHLSCDHRILRVDLMTDAGLWISRNKSRASHSCSCSQAYQSADQRPGLPTVRSCGGRGILHQWFSTAECSASSSALVSPHSPQQHRQYRHLSSPSSSLIPQKLLSGSIVVHHPLRFVYLAIHGMCLADLGPRPQ